MQTFEGFMWWGGDYDWGPTIIMAQSFDPVLYGLSSMMSHAGWDGEDVSICEGDGVYQYAVDHGIPMKPQEGLRCDGYFYAKGQPGEAIKPIFEPGKKYRITVEEIE